MSYGQQVHPYSSWLWLGGEAGDRRWLGADGSLSLWPYTAGEYPMYLVNHVRLALGLEGTPDPTNAQVQAAVAATGYTGYVAEDYTPAAPAPPKSGTGGSGGSGSGGSGTK